MSKINFLKGEIRMFNMALSRTAAIAKKSRRYEGSLVIGVPGEPGAFLITKKGASEVLMHHFPKTTPKDLANEGWPKESYSMSFCEKIEWLEFASWLVTLISGLQDPELHYRDDEYDDLARSCFGHL